MIARAHSQGSRLSAVRLAKTTAAADVIGFAQGFCEDALYENLSWLCENQEAIEKRLFAFRRGHNKPDLFLYDVTSSYLEGDHNALADWGSPPIDAFTSRLTPSTWLIWPNWTDATR